METGENWGETLKNLRKQASLTQPKLADYLVENEIFSGLDKTQISRYEKNKRQPTRELAVALVRAFALKKTLTEPQQADTWLAQKNWGLSQAEQDEIFPGKPRFPRRGQTIIPASKAVRLVGREEDLAWLRQQLTPGSATALAGVRGIGGIGKTELAIAIAKEFRDQMPGGVVWLQAGANEPYAVQAQLAEHMGIPELAETENLLARHNALTLALEQFPPALIVIDDVREEHIQSFDFLKPPAPHALLVTSRHKDLPLPPGAMRRVDVLPPEAAETLLRDVLHPDWAEAEPKTLTQIALFLERIPLALWLAGRRAWVIAGRRDGSEKRPLATLLQELQVRKPVLVLHESEQRADLSVLLTFDLSYEELNQAGQQRLAQLGVFAQGYFPLGWMAAVWGEDAAAAREQLKSLANAGLLEELGEDIWWMHELLHEYTKEKLKSTANTIQDQSHLRHAQLFLNSPQMTESSRIECLRATAYINDKAKKQLRKIPESSRQIFELTIIGSTQLIDMIRGSFQHGRH